MKKLILNREWTQMNAKMIIEPVHFFNIVTQDIQDNMASLLSHPDYPVHPC